MKQRILRVLTGRAVARLFHPLTRRRVAIFGAHRFREPGVDAEGTDVAALRHDLAYLRREGYTFPSLADAVRRLAHDPGSLYKAVVFTIDDGYRDFHDLAAPVFAEFDCPATVFLPTGFLDGTTWLWWDRVEYVFHETRHEGVAVELDTGVLTLDWTDRRERRAASLTLVAAMKRLSESAKLETIARLADRLEVDLPAAAPPAYAPLSWDQVRDLVRRGMSFGPHTVTHPVLSRASDAQSRQELEHSWKRLREETPEAVPVFAYPNGHRDDFAAREAGVLDEMGMVAAVTMEPGYAEPRYLDGGAPLARYALPRFGYPPRHHTVVRIASGLERVRLLAQQAPWSSHVASLQHAQAFGLDRAPARVT